MHISRYMDPQLVSFIDADSQEKVLAHLVDLIHQAGKLDNKDQFLKAITEREKIVSTGIGMGVAIPHAKLSSYDHFFIAVGILKKPIEWNSLDGAPVRMIFMIGGPDDKQTEYLQILSGLTKAIKDEERRKKILTLTKPTDIIELFKVI
jgi:nitrogen PTS system EIIA component